MHNYCTKIFYAKIRVIRGDFHYRNVTGTW